MQSFKLMLVSLFCFSLMSAFAQQDPAPRSTYFFTCSTYIDVEGAPNKLTAIGRFFIDDLVGLVEFAVVPDDYNRPSGHRFSFPLSDKNVSIITKRSGGRDYQIVEEVAGMDVKVIFAEKLTDNSGKVYYDGSSYAVFCTKELDIYSEKRVEEQKAAAEDV